jgi:hypothetical protein
MGNSARSESRNDRCHRPPDRNSRAVYRPFREYTNIKGITKEGRESEGAIKSSGRGSGDDGIAIQVDVTLDWPHEARKETRRGQKS